MTTFNWQVSALDCIPQEGDLTDVVIIVHWRCTGEEIDGDKTYTGTVYSTCSVPAPEGTFTPYQDLTLDQVLGWIWANGVNKEATEAAVQSQIANQINPPVVAPPLPWTV